MDVLKFTASVPRCDGDAKVLVVFPAAMPCSVPRKKLRDYADPELYVAAQNMLASEAPGKYRVLIMRTCAHYPMRILAGFEPVSAYSTWPTLAVEVYDHLIRSESVNSLKYMLHYDGIDIDDESCVITAARAQLALLCAPKPGDEPMPLIL